MTKQEIKNKLTELRNAWLGEKDPTKRLVIEKQGKLLKMALQTTAPEKEKADDFELTNEVETAQKILGGTII